MINETWSIIIIVGTALVALGYSVFNYSLIKNLEGSYKERPRGSGRGSRRNEEEGLLVGQGNQELDAKHLSAVIMGETNDVLVEEIKHACIIAAIVAIFLIFCIEEEFGTFWLTMSFIFGVLTVIICVFYGCNLACMANVKTVLKSKATIQFGFKTGYRAAIAIGFFFISMGILVPLITVAIYRAHFEAEYAKVFEHLLGYTLGVTVMTLVLRIGGHCLSQSGAFATELYGKTLEAKGVTRANSPTDLIWNIGENLAGVVGNGADIFASFTVIFTVVLLMSAEVDDLMKPDDAGSAFWFPFLLVAGGLGVSLFATFFVTLCSLVTVSEHPKYIENNIKWQIILVALLSIPLLIVFPIFFMPDTFKVGEKEITHAVFYYCAFMGLGYGILNSFINEYFTSRNFSPVKNAARNTKCGSSPTILQSFVLGHLSVILPLAIFIVIIYLAHMIGDYYGIAILGLGLISYCSILIAFSALWPIFHCAVAISKSSRLDETTIRNCETLEGGVFSASEVTRSLEFAVGVIAVLLIFFAFIARAETDEINIMSVINFVALIFGGFLPYLFASLYMKSIASTQRFLIKEVRRDLDILPSEQGERTSHRYIEDISKDFFLLIVLPAFLILSIITLFGYLLGPTFISTILIGALISGLGLAYTQSNSCAVLANIRDYVTKYKLKNKKGDKVYGEDSEAWRAALAGGAYGLSMRETFALSYSLVFKTVCVLCVVFTNFFSTHAIIAEAFGLPAPAEKK